MARFRQKLADWGAEADSAEQTFNQRKEQVLELLGRLQVSVSNYGKGTGGPANDWGYAGSMGHVLEVLKEAYEHLDSASQPKPSMGVTPEDESEEIG